MDHASQLDFQAYENPVFYDRLERARVQATDRLGMIQSIGRLVPAGGHYDVSLSVAILCTLHGCCWCSWAAFYQPFWVKVILHF